MKLIDTYSLLTPHQHHLLASSASQAFNIGGYKSLDDILTSLNVDVIIEPGIVPRSGPSDLDAIENYWQEEVSRIKRESQKDRSNIDILELDKAQGKVNTIQRERKALSNMMPLRGLYEPKNVIKLFPEEMGNEYGGKCMDELLVSTLAHETMHAYFNRPGHDKFPYLMCVEEPLAEFGMLLYLYETKSDYYKWAYDDVNNKKTCYEYGVDLMNQHLKESPKSSIFCYLEEYKIDLEYYQMPDFVGGTIVMPQGGGFNQMPVFVGGTIVVSKGGSFTIADIIREHKIVLGDRKYSNDIGLIEKIIRAHPLNDDIFWIAIKISMIDVINSTQLSKQRAWLSLYDIAEIILNLKIDGCIKAGNPEVVSRIARECKRRYGVNLFSFASKYCVYHNIFAYGKDDFSIFDNIVSKNLYKYSTAKNPLKVTQPDRWRNKIDYKAFNDYIGALLDEKGIYKSVKGRRRMFDHFVWHRHK